MTELLFDTPGGCPRWSPRSASCCSSRATSGWRTACASLASGVVCLAILLTAVSYYVDTPRETAERRTRELCYAFERADWATMTSILDPNTAVTVLSANVYNDRDAIMKGARAAHERYGLQDRARPELRAPSRCSRRSR
jgi:hypothetical protein